MYLIYIFVSTYAVLYFLGYHMSNYPYYIFLPLLIIKSSSMVASLSALTTNVYSLIFAIFLFNNQVNICICMYICIQYSFKFLWYKFFDCSGILYVFCSVNCQALHIKLVVENFMFLCS